MPASDIRTQPVEIELDRKRKLRYDFNALALLEDKFGDIDTALHSLTQQPSVKAIRALLHAGLVHEDPALTEEQVGSMVTLADMPRVAQAISEAFAEAMPKLDPTSSPPAPPANTGT